MKDYNKTIKNWRKGMYYDIGYTVGEWFTKDELKFIESLIKEAYRDGQHSMIPIASKKVVKDIENCICAEYDGKGLSTCGVPCPVHKKQ